MLGKRNACFRAVRFVQFDLGHKILNPIGPAVKGADFSKTRPGSRAADAPIVGEADRDIHGTPPGAGLTVECEAAFNSSPPFRVSEAIASQVERATEDYRSFLSTSQIALSRSSSLKGLMSTVAFTRWKKLWITGLFLWPVKKTNRCPAAGRTRVTAQ